MEYAPRGLLGVLTPQANTTVEPELSILMPPGYAWINARLVSARGSIEERLEEYLANYENALSQFANAPVKAIAIACSGPSYFIGPEREDQLLAELSDKAGVPVYSATRSVIDALELLGARRVALVSPYPQGLQDASIRYWTERGMEVVTCCSAYRETSAFHPIYSLPGNAAQQALNSIQETDADAVVLLGTGMPTVGPIVDTLSVGAAPVLSCMFCLAWRAIAELDSRRPLRQTLLDLARSAVVQDRLHAIRSVPVGPPGL